MKRLLIFAAVSALALAKPELYKEQEDFQYSRSSSDDGSKSGFYGAQRGNMGGNYERAHNMDSLAQNQMSGLVRQVEGELGDGANMRTGQVYTSANSKGIYGSGHFDLSNLAGRNFNEGTYYGNSQSHSSQSQSSSAQSKANYASNSHSHSNSMHIGYQTADAQTQTDDLQSPDNLQATNQYYNYGRHSSGFQSQAGFQEQGEYANSNANSNSGHESSNIRTRIISATPVRVVLTPGGRVAIPVAAQTYDATQGSSALEQNVQNSNSMSISDDNQGYIPSNAKHYESSYRYHKKWEKHDPIPTGFTVVPVTYAPLPQNSELLEDRDAHLQQNYDTRGLNSHSEHSSSSSGSYSGVKSSSQSRYQSKYNSQYHGDSSSNSNANLNDQFRHAGANHGESLQSSLNANSHSDLTGFGSDLNSQVENLNTKPKSYHSSYSYHKSWERQGDPYVIKPASSGYYDNQASQRLTNQGYAAHQSGSHYNQNQADCDENGHLRIARSSYTDNKDMQQQNQNLEDLDELTQQVRQYTGDLSQQSQTQWGQQDLGQQSQNKWEKLENLNQQAQNNWGQQPNLEQSNVDQQFQNQNQRNNLELGQQSQTNLEQQNVGQESQNQWDTFENLGLQSNKNWGAFQPNTFDDITQQQQISHTNPEKFRKQFQNYGGEHNQDTEQQQTHQSHNNNTGTSIDASQKELEDKVSHKVENPWDKFDINDAHKVNKPTTEQNKDDFYWHHIPNNDMEDQRINKLNANGDVISGFGHRYIHTGPIVEQANEYPGFDSSYNPNVPYSYSNGFVNPIIYNKRNFYPDNQNNQQVNSGNIYSWPTQIHNNYDSQVSWQTHATESNSFSQESKILSLWDKFDTIEKESHFSTDDLKYVPKQGDNTISLTNTQQSAETTSASTHISQTDGKLDNSSDNQVTPKQESQTVSPKKYSVSGTELPEEIENSNGKDPETPQDIGRGDIGADDSFSPPIIPKPRDGDNNNYLRNSSDDKNFNVLGLKPQETKQKDDVEHDLKEVSQQDNHNNLHTSSTKLNDKEITEQDRENTQNDKLNFHNTQDIHHTTNFEQQAPHTVEQDKRQDFAQQNHYLEQQNLHYFNQQNAQNFGQQSENVPQNVQDFGQQNENVEQNIQDFGQQSENFEQNIQDFGQQSVNIQQNFGQQSENDQQNVQDFGQQSENIQQNVQDFGQQNENDQQNVQDFGQQSENIQQNVQDFGQQSENNQQNVQDFGQQNVQDFGQQSENIQQNVQDFGQQSENIQQNVQDFGEQSENLEQNVQDFGQQSENVPQNVRDFGEQNIRDFGQQSENDQQNVQDFGQQSENIQQNVQDFGQQSENDQQNVQDFGQQSENDQQNVQDFGQQSDNIQQNVQDFGQQSENDQQNVQDFGQQSENIQQNVQDFGQQSENDQQNVQDFGQQSENLEQNVQDFGQRENIPQNVQEFGHESNIRELRHDTDSVDRQIMQNIDKSILEPHQLEQNLNQENVNQKSLQQENALNIWTENKQLRQQHLQDYGQISIQDFRLPKPNNAQQHYRNIDIPNEDLSYSDKLHQLENPKKEVQPEIIQEHTAEQITEKIAEQKQIQNVEQPNVTEKDNSNLQTVIEKTAEKPGFWKSLGNKLTNAKSKVASWFKS